MPCIAASDHQLAKSAIGFAFRTVIASPYQKRVLSFAGSCQTSLRREPFEVSRKEALLSKFDYQT